MIAMDKEQVKRILKYIDENQPQEVKQAVFCRLGTECFLVRNIKNWIDSFGHDVQKFIDRVNVDNSSPYWEKFEFNADETILYLTGKKVSACACEFGDMKQPPESLCTYCCKTFQENIFSTLFEYKVEVEIVESLILGGERCSTAIHLK